MPSLSTQILSQVLKITGQAYNTPVIVEIPHAFFLIPPVSFLFLYLLIPCFVLFFSPFFPLVVQYRVYIYNKTTMFSHFLLKTKEAALICSGRLPCSIGHFLIKAPGIIQHGGELTETATPVLSSQICLHCCSVSSCFSRSPPFDGFSCEHFYSSL